MQIHNRNLLTIEHDNIDLHGKIVLARLDLDSPYNREEHHIDDNERLNAAARTITTLQEQGAIISIMGHQGRPGNQDFTSTRRHAEILSEKINQEILYFDGLFGRDVEQHIAQMKPGQVIMLQNIRFFSEEMIERATHKHADSYMIRRLQPLFDYYVNDAFAVCHRAHASIIGFSEIPNLAGPQLVSEISALDDFLNTHTEGKRVLVLGGKKIGDYYGLMEKLVQSNEVDHILLTGYLANIALIARGFSLGKEEEHLHRQDEMTGKSLMDEFDRAKQLFEGHSDKFVLPEDLAILGDDNERHNVELVHFPQDHYIKDIGDKTIKKFSDIIAGAASIFFKGTPGEYEDQRFEKGTKELLSAIANAKGFSLIGGGNTGDAIDDYDLRNKFNHTSLAGGATLKYLQQRTLPGIQRLEQSYEQFHE